MDEITLSRNYRGLWESAKQKRSLEAYESVFELLAGEIGLPNPAREQAQSSYSEEAARRRNEAESGGMKRKP